MQPNREKKTPTNPRDWKPDSEGKKSAFKRAVYAATIIVWTPKPLKIFIETNDCTTGDWTAFFKLAPQECRLSCSGGTDSTQSSWSLGLTSFIQKAAQGLNSQRHHDLACQTVHTKNIHDWRYLARCLFSLRVFRWLQSENAVLRGCQQTDRNTPRDSASPARPIRERWLHCLHSTPLQRGLRTATQNFFIDGAKIEIRTMSARLVRMDAAVARQRD